MISRLVGDDDLESPAPWLVALANGFNIEFSAFIGAKGLFRSVIYQANERDRAALFGYAVRQSLQGSGLGNMLEDPAVGSLYDFADQVLFSLYLYMAESYRLRAKRSIFQQITA